MGGLDNVTATGSTALAAAMFIQWLKNSGWATWFTRETSKANAALGVVTAGLLSIGIHFTWDSAKDTLVIVGLYGALTHGIWQWFLQWAAQHTAYKIAIVPGETLGEIRAILQRQNPPPISQGEAKAEALAPSRPGVIA